MEETNTNQTSGLKTRTKFDMAVSGLQGGNNPETRPTTIEHTALTGEQESYMVQTIRHEYKVRVMNKKTGEWETQTRIGTSVILKVMDADARTVRLVLPPKVTDAIASQRIAVSKKARRIASKAAMQERMANGYVPTPPPRPQK